jgi:uncharacterized Zn-binding protein involved in type VI secretion
LAAARLGDSVAHTDSGFGFGMGGLLGLAAGALLVGATIATGGAALAVVAAVGGAVALTGGGALEGMSIGATYGHTVGDIATGSPTVWTNGAQAARTLADVADCQDHSGPQQIATGSTSVFINGVPAARLGDHTVCDARISTASANVFIAGGWAGAGVFGLQAAGGIGGGLLGGALGGAIGGAIDPVHGAAWGQAVGGLGGGVGGGLAGGAAAEGLGLSGAGSGGTANLAAGDAAADGATPADQARAFQGQDPYPGTDNWTNTNLPKGTVVYGATPGQGSFYTTADGLASTDGTAQGYYDALQIAPGTNPAYPPYRSGVTAYQVNTDNLPAASSQALANPGNGAGGAPQYYIPDYQTGLTPIGTTPFK